MGFDSWQRDIISNASDRATAATADQPGSAQASAPESREALLHELHDMHYDLMVLQYPQRRPQIEQLRAAAEAKTTQDAVVKISTDSTIAGMQATGTAFFVRTEGRGNTGVCHIATDDHNIQDTVGPSRITMKDGSTYQAELEVKDPKQDLAIFKIVGIEDPIRTCPTLPLGSSEALAPGTPVAIINNDTGTPGIFKGQDSRARIQNVHEAYNEDMNRQIMIFDAKANPGDSGSPIIDPSGQVVGLTWAGGGNVAGGTPVEDLKKDLDTLH